MRIAKTLVCDVMVACLLAQVTGAAAQPRSALSSYDSWTYTQAFERSKTYSPLVAMLEDLLTQQAGADLEGQAYMLDDLAEIYTSGLIDFEKALAHNRRAEEAVQRIADRGLTNVPVSDYFNQRRRLYYYFYPLTSTPNATPPRALALDGSERPFFGRSDRATRFAPSVLEAVRARDLEALGVRVKARQEYLGRKLGVLSSRHRQPVPAPSGRDEFQMLADVLNEHPAMNDYYQAFFLAQHLWNAHLRGEAVDFTTLSRLGEQALARPQGERADHDLDSANLLRYWLAFAYLQTGRLKQGTALARQFFIELDRVDDVERKAVGERRAILGRAIDEKRRKWEILVIAVTLAVTAASMGMAVGAVAGAAGTALGTTQTTYTSVQQAVSAQMAAQQSLDAAMRQSFYAAGAAFASTMTLGQASAYLADAQSAADVRRSIGGLTPLALQAARYMNKFEQVEFFGDLARSYEQLDDGPRALRLLEEALAHIEAQRSTISSEDQRISFARVKEDLYQRIIRILVHRGQAAKDIDDVLGGVTVSRVDHAHPAEPGRRAFGRRAERQPGERRPAISGPGLRRAARWRSGRRWPAHLG